jgi:polar amino acid transport system substrate-binding protein
MHSLFLNSKQRFFFVVSFFVLLSMLLAACGSTSSNTTTGGSSKPAIAAPSDLLTSGVLTVGSDTTYPPQEFPDVKNPGSYTGFDIDLITAIAQKMGLKAQIEKADFGTIITSLSNKRFDVVISAVTINDDRKKVVDFVPYFNAGESLLVQKGNPKNLKTTADLCGQDVGVQKGTVEQDDLTAANTACKKAGKAAINVTVLQDQTAVVQLLATNRVVATYQDSPVTDYYNKLNPGQFEVGGSVVNAAQEGIVVRKGDTSMFNAVQSALKSLQSDGTYKNLINKWGVTTGAISFVDSRSRYA